MPVSDQLKGLIARFPEPDGSGTCVNLDAAKIEAMEAVVADLAKGGREAVLGLIDMLVEPGKGDDVKPHFAFHLLAVHVTGLGNEAARADFARTVASQVGSDRPKAVQGYLIQELQVAGGREVAAVLGKALLDPDLCDDAARALAAIGDGAADELLAALPRVKGRSRLSVLKKLAILRCGKAAEAFRRALGDADADIRIAGAWGAARIADASAADAMMKAADGAGAHWERINLTDACLVLADGLHAAGRKTDAVRIWTHLRDTRTERADAHVRGAAERALKAAT
jgi:hypothetical protein